METTPFDQKQREVFERMLVQAKGRAQADLESDTRIDLRVEAELMPKLIAQLGGSELFDKVRKLRDEMREAERSLARLGFNCSSDHTTLLWNVSEAIRQELEAAKRSAHQEDELSLKKFDQAILDVWTATTVEDARKIVEGLL